MPINAADARQLAQVMLTAYGEDYQLIASMLRPLRAQWPTINWVGELTSVAMTFQPFLDSGLSIEWWLAVVDERSQP